jgi:hypothetical protein
MKTKAPGTPAGRRRRLERQAVVLAKFCPVDRTNPDNCPLCGLRLLAPEARRVWVHGLTLKELQYLVLYHANCAAERKRTAAVHT